MRFPLLFPLLTAALVASGSGRVEAQRRPAAAPYAEGTSLEAGEVVFRLHPQVRAAARANRIEHRGVQQALAAIGAHQVRQPFPRAVAPDPKRGSGAGVDLTLTYRARFAVAIPFAEVQRRLLATGAVAWVEPHYRRELLVQPNDLFADSTRTNGQYHLKNVRAYRAWDVATGDSTVVVGVTDTGARLTHHDLKPQLAINRADPPNGLDDDNDGYIDNTIGWDLADNDNNAGLDATNIGNPQPYHGAQVSGASSAATNNGRGVAGTGYACRFMPIKIYNTTPGGSFAGFEGIVYAADHGCRVINCSWGGVGGWSQYEQDCITYATHNRDAVVVAAAGNTNADLDFYPASYVGVVSVASLARDDVKAPSATYSYRISLCAPGRQIITTGYAHDSSYVVANGSSFAAPIVAGAVALLRVHYPALTALQAAERIRVTADTGIYALAGNAAFAEQLGRGRLDMARALLDSSARSLRATRVVWAPAGAARGGDTLAVHAAFVNYLAPLGACVVRVSSPTPGVQVLAGGPLTLGPLGPLDSAAVPPGQPFRLVLPPTTAPNAVVALRFAYHDSASQYRDYQYVTLALNPTYLTLDSTAVAVTVGARGHLGYDSGDPRYGRSVALTPRGHHLLSEGGLLVGAGADRVSDGLRSATPGQPDQDFAITQPLRFVAPLPWAAQTATGAFADTLGAAQAGIGVSQRAWNSHYPGCARAVVTEYALINQAADTLRTAYAGLFADWDLGAAEHNIARWDSTRRLAWVAPARTGTDTVFAALKLLTHQPAATYAFDQQNPTAPGAVNATDGLTTAEKWAALVAAPGSPAEAGTAPGGTDVAHLVRAALPPLAPADTVRVAWAVLAAPSLAALLTAADSIQSLFDATQAVPAVPVAIGASRCGPGALALVAAGALPRGTYQWYAASAGGSALHTGPTFTTPVLAASDTFFVSTRTRLGREGARVPVLAVIDTVPAAPVVVATPQATGTLLLTTQGQQIAQFYRNGTLLSGAVNDSLLLTAAAQNGVYTATVTSARGCVSPLSAAVTVSITGRDDAVFTAAVVIFPNPTTGDAFLTLPAPAHVTVLDALGRRVLTQPAPAGPSTLPLACLPRGVYCVRMVTAAGVLVQRLVRE